MKIIVLADGLVKPGDHGWVHHVPAGCRRVTCRMVTNNYVTIQFDHWRSQVGKQWAYHPSRIEVWEIVDMKQCKMTIKLPHVWLEVDLDGMIYAQPARLSAIHYSPINNQWVRQCRPPLSVRPGRPTTP